MDNRKPILTVYEDDMGLDLDIDADGGQLIAIIKAIADAILEATGTNTH